MKKLIIAIIIILLLIVFVLIANSNSHETVGEILEEIEADHGEIVSMILIKGEDDKNEPYKLDREQYGITGESLAQFVNNISDLEVDTSKVNDMETTVYTFITHTINREDQILQFSGYISKTGLSFDNEIAYKLKEPERFQEIIDNYIDQSPY